VCSVCGGGGKIQCIVEIFRNTEEETGAPQEKMAAYQRRKSTQEDTRTPKCHWKEKLRHLAYNTERNWEKEAHKVYK
jgi:hypothetical protein